MPVSLLLIRAFSGMSAACLIALLLFNGCQTLQGNIGETARPLMSIVYYPYGPAIDRSIASPHPDFSGWSDQRMRMDLRRIHRAGFDQIILRIDLPYLQNDPSTYASRVRHFIDMAHALASSDSPGIVIELDCDQILQMDIDLNSVLRWVESLKLHEAHVYSKLEGLPLIRLRGESTPKKLKHVGLAIDDNDRDEVRLIAGKYNRIAMKADSWLIPRDKGKTAIHEMKRAVQSGTSSIVLESWNDFWSGSFIQPNSLDKDIALERVSRYLRR